MNRGDTFAIATAARRNSRHWKLGTITWGELCDWLKEPASKKEAGNYLLGTLAVTTVAHDPKQPDKRCTEVHRRKSAVISRSAVTLDIDSPDKGFENTIELVLPYAAIVHTTYSSAPDAPRFRMIVPLDREVLPDEYAQIADSLMDMLGAHQFDHGSDEPERYMFKPAAQEQAWFSYTVLDGDALVADELLDGWERDLSHLPMPSPSRTKRDPFDLPGVVGAFNQVYEDLDHLIKEYELPYEKVDENRYHLVGSAAEAGMGPIAGTRGLFFSHHSNDPAGGVTCSAFDIVRLHRFGELDEKKSSQTPVNKLPSHTAMMELASTDHRVVAHLVGADFSDEMNEEVVAKNSWRTSLRLSNAGKFQDTIQNWDLVVENDPVFAQLRYNELTLSPEWVGDQLPWRAVTDRARIVSPADRWEIVYYLEREYRIRVSKEFAAGLTDARAARHWTNPVREHLESLVWDGVRRVETCLPGVRPTKENRLIARKSMVAAVARMLTPGCKWDHTLVLFGPEGLGKTWWIDRMSRGHSGTLGRIDNKDTLLAMQRAWIVTSDEGHSFRKADSEALKEFLTRTHDIFRMPYERETLAHPRHCVIWSTTNDEIFLRRQEGNRRFLVVHCEKRVDFDAITDDYVDQVWAEAVHLYNEGETLFLDLEQSEALAMTRERFVEEDSLPGVLEEWLNQKVPKNWWDLTPEGRMSWLRDKEEGFASEGEISIDMTCSRLLWREALGYRTEPRRMELLDITNALRSLPGWIQLEGRHRVPGYGAQMKFVREDLL